jgi:beta-glucosidase
MSHARPYRRVAAVVLLALIAALTVVVGAPARINHHPGDGGGPAYKDPRNPVDVRVRDLLGRMTLDQKIGQMGQINSYVLLGDPGTPWDWPGGGINPAIAEQVFAKDLIGSVLSGGGAWPPSGANDGKAWADFINSIQAEALKPERNPLGIPIIYGADGVHGHNNLSDAIDFPHQVGLGASFDPGLVYAAGRATGKAMRATGVAWDFAPVLDTERDLRWGRSYEPFGEDPLLTGTLGASFIRGAQGRDLADGDSVVATAKHFTGYSAPDNGHDRTNATISESELQDLHLPPFQSGIDAGVGTAMANSGSVNGVPVHMSHELLTDKLRGELHFRGVLITDWQDIENLVTKYHEADTMQEAVTLAFNAGIDMSMIPLAPDDSLDEQHRAGWGFVDAMRAAVRDGDIPQWRIDQAVGRILALKFRLGLFEHPYVDASAANAAVEDPGARALSRKAAEESLVLLKNDGTLPLAKRSQRVLVTGPQSDSPTNQLGGWSVGWQGAFNLPASVTIPPTTTLREGLEASAPQGTSITWKQGAPVGDTINPGPVNDPNDPAVKAARDEAVAAAANADVIVAAVGESPYAETPGDDDTPELSPAQAALVDALAATGKPVVVVVMSGRPLVMNAQLDEARSALMAFWPGTEGGAAVADALFGKVNPSGRLPVPWPKASAQLPLAFNEPGKPYDPRYPFGHGLSYSRVVVKDLDAPRKVGRHGRVPVKASLANFSPRGVDEVVLAVVERLSGPSTAAPRQLVAFRREHLRGWDRDKVSLSFDVGQLAVTQAGGKSVVPGAYRLWVDGASRTFVVR